MWAGGVKRVSSGRIFELPDTVIWVEYRWRLRRWFGCLTFGAGTATGKDAHEFEHEQSAGVRGNINGQQ